MLIVPYTKLAQEARDNPGSVDLKEVDARTIHLELTACGRLAISPYEGLAKHRPALQSIQAKKVRVVLVFDEIQALLDCEGNGGYR